MMSLFCERSSLMNEIDVEQKFIYQLTTSSYLLGLGYKDSHIQTKRILRQQLIGKSKQKYYFPDYLIALRGIPVLVIEAKSPDIDLGDSYSEARLYASEVNAQFPHNINVCNKIMVCNGLETWAGFSDQAEPFIKLIFEDFKVENRNFVKLLNFCSKSTLIKIANQPYIDIRGNATFSTPVSNLGGKRTQDEELEENTYGRTLVFENRNIFNPQTEDDRIEIVKNAYIKSSKREQHIDPMYKEIKRLKLPSNVHSTFIPTDDPQQFVDKIENNHTEIDFTQLDIIEKLFKNEISKFKKGIGKLIIGDSELYNSKLFSLLEDCCNNREKTLKAYFNFIKRDLQ